MHFRKKTLMHKVTALSIIAILLPTCIFSVYYGMTAGRHFQDKVVEERYSALNVIGQTVLDKVTVIETTLDMLSQNEHIRKFLTDQNLNTYSRIIQQRYNVRDAIQQARTVLASLGVEITLIIPDSEMLESHPNFLKLENFETEQDYLQFQQTGNIRSWVGAAMMFPQNTFDAGNDNFLKFCCYQNILVGKGKRAGVLKCGADIDKLFSSIELDQPDRHVYVIQNDHVIHQSKNAPGLADYPFFESQWQLLDGCMYLVKNLDQLNVKLVMSIEDSRLWIQSLINVFPQIAVAVCSCLILLMIVRKLMSSIQKRVDQVILMTDKVRDGHLDIAFPNPDESEIGQLIDAFNILLERLRGEAETRIAHEKIEKEAMRLALQYQVNPHFLFNTLNWMQMEVELGSDRERISDAIILLSRMLRYNLNKQATTTLLEEVEIAKNYVRLMNLRKHDLITLSFDLKNLPDESQLIRFLFQPICENAIQHGLVPGHKLHILIHGWQENGIVFFSVENDGSMIPLEKLENLNSTSPEAQWQGGVGLANVYARLQLLYGGEAELKVTSVPKKTCVLIHFPMHD